jgi:hypothetical protein
MTRLHRLVVCVALSPLFLAALPTRAQLIGPEAYLSFNDSPFRNINFSNGYFYLETFEDGLFNVPGVTAISNTPGTTLGVNGPGPFADSVDGDDGVIDGSGTGGHDFAIVQNTASDNLGYTFVFDAAQLGGLPTHVGIVWTDGSPSAPTQFQAFGPGDVLIGTIGPVQISDGSFAGGTAEDRFFGVISEGGISRFTIRSPGGANNLTVDHLQYGNATAVVVPEASTLALALPAVCCLATARLGMVGAFLVRRRKK